MDKTQVRKLLTEYKEKITRQQSVICNEHIQMDEMVREFLNKTLDMIPPEAGVEVLSKLSALTHQYRASHDIGMEVSVKAIDLVLADIEQGLASLDKMPTLTKEYGNVN